MIEEARGSSALAVAAPRRPPLAHFAIINGALAPQVKAVEAPRSAPPPAPPPPPPGPGGGAMNYRLAHRYRIITAA